MERVCPICALNVVGLTEVEITWHLIIELVILLPQLSSNGIASNGVSMEVNLTSHPDRGTCNNIQWQSKGSYGVLETQFSHAVPMGSGYEPKGRAHASLPAGIQWDKNGELEKNCRQIGLVIFWVYSISFAQTSQSLQVRNNIGIGLEIMARCGPDRSGRHRGSK